ncbi:MAG: hypothetical protein DRI57_10130 [Deltaproteobacteria bacterium]|nr:MAG: hypothetical protein DRI57_10130 [Deltaproteobacteria bacterium]
MNMKKTADVVIIGGGIQGASALCYLCEAGIRNVMLIEMDKLGGASSTTAYTSGWVMLQEEDEINIRMSQMSFLEFLRFEEKYGIDINFIQNGSLSIDTTDHSERFHKRAEIHKTFGIHGEILSREDIRSVAPFLNLSDIESGLFSKNDGKVNADSVLQGYIRQAKRLGAEICEGTKAVNIKVRNGKVAGVETTSGFIHTPVVVNAAGIYAKQVARWAGIRLPLTNALLHVVLTEPTPMIQDNMPLIEVLNPELIYVEGRTSIGSEGNIAEYSLGNVKTESFDHVAQLELFTEKYADHILYRIPEIFNLGITNCYAGIRTLTPDDFPILGHTDEVEGYVSDCGWGGRGISHAPAGGRLIAECISKTHKLPVSIEPFLLSRFKGHALSHCHT